VLGTLWLSGVTLDWAVLHAKDKRLRVPLPTYPFERQSYWVESPEVLKHQQHNKLLSTQKHANSADWFYVPTWQQAPTLLAQDHLSQEHQTWLLFANASDFSNQLARKLQDNAQTVIQVYAGAQFSHPDANTYIISPSNPYDYQQLVQQLVAKGMVPSRVIHAWNVLDTTTIEGSLSAIDDFQQAQWSGLYSLLYLFQALNNQFLQHAVHLDVLTTGMQKVHPHDQIRAALATMLGACKVLPQEYLNTTCRCIDLSINEHTPDQLASLVDLLFNELTSSPFEPVVAYCDTTRWLLQYSPIHLPAPDTIPNRLRRGGSYLITGGSGHIGLLLADYLARTVQAQLILVGRTSFPPRQEWSSWLQNHPHDELMSQKMRSIQQIEARGTEVLIFQADVANVEQIEAVFAQLERLGRPIHGIFHAAGITGEDSFKDTQETSRDDCELHFQSKVYGLLALEKVLQARSLDFCLLFSSLASLLGGLGLFAYASANAFMDAFAQHANQQGTTPWLSVNWDTWLVQPPQNSSPGSTVASYAMTAEEGCKAIAHVLSTHHIVHLVNSTGDLAARIRQWVLLEALHKHEELTQQPSTQTLSTSAHSTRRLPRSEYEQMLTAIWQEVLGLPEVGLYENFFDLGGNSLTGLQVVARIRKMLQIQLSVVALFEAPTIQAMTDYLLSTLAPLAQEAPEKPETRLQQRRNTAHTRQGSADIAILAMTGRFPGAESVEQFWHNLQNGVESITFFDEEELLRAGVDPAVVRDPQYVKARPMLPPELVEQFDAAFFGYSPREAELLDPQHRLFLECCWEVLERAGYAPQQYAGRIGVFGGANISTYLHAILQQPDLVASLHEIFSDYQIAISMDKDSLTTAVSYKLHLTGPSLAVQTFCSTSLVAVHLACQSLLNGECDMSLAGGVSVSVPVQRGYHYEPGGMESPDGHCRTFDAQAHGSMFGDGVGVVVLKRLADALDDGDQILAVLKGSAINNDGALKVSYTAPSVIGQAQVVQDALRNAGVPAESISYVEAHGTATDLGDPIEVTSLTRAYRTETTKQQFCAIGSVKTNVGHLDRAAGISGLMKTVLALQHEQIPASLHYHEPNPEIDFAQSPFYVNAQLSSWPRSSTPRRAGVNSLGMGGTNVHVILEEAPLRDASSDARPWQLIPLSARTKTALQAASHHLGTHLRAHPDLKLADVAYTLQVGRTLFAHRQVLICRDGEEAATALLSDDPRRLLSSQQEQRDRPVAFLFPGSGEQLVRNSLELYVQEATFKTWIDHCCKALIPYIHCDLREVLFRIHQSTNQHSEHKQADIWTLIQDKAYRETAIQTASERLKSTPFIHAAIFTIDYALAQLFLQWGVQPQSLSGYGPGEYVAACIAGILSLDDALKLTIRKAELLQDQTITTPSIQDELMSLLHTIMLHPPAIPCLSSVTDAWITDEQATDPSYWVMQMSQPNHIPKGIEHVLRQEDLLLLELGAGQSFTTYLQQHPACTAKRRQLLVASLPTHDEQTSTILLTLGKLWLHGVNLNWSCFYAHEQRHRVLLPTYPFERQRYWLADIRSATTSSQPVTNTAIERKPTIDDWFYQSTWRQVPLNNQRVQSSPSNAPWLVLADTSGLGDCLIEQLTQMGIPVISVQADAQFSQIDAHTFCIRPQEASDYQQLCTAMSAQGILPRRILHCWNVTETMLLSVPTTFAAMQQQGFFSLLWLTQALATHTYDQPVTIFVCSTYAQAVLPTDVMQPEKASIQGACNVIPQEPLNIACCSIDLDVPTDYDWSEQATLVLAECLHPTSNVVAYRQGKRWLQEYKAVSLPPPSPEQIPFRRQGVYLITGGLGGIGLVLAEYLAHTYEARLVLLGRSGLPPRQQWSEWMQTHPEDDALSLKMARLQAMEAQGAQILIYQADVADAHKLHTIVQETRTIFGALHGVFHAAGITDNTDAFKLVQEIDQAACEMHFQSKVYGTYALAQAISEIDLDFCMLFSSLSAVLGGLGFAAYSAANLFLDAFTQHHNRRSTTPWSTVNWDTWLVKQNAHGKLGASIAAFAMQPPEAIEALLRAMTSGRTRLINSTGDLHMRLQQWIRLDLLQEMEQSTLPTSSAQSIDNHEHIIRSIWQEVLGVKDVGLHENFFDLGGNSLIAIQLISKLKKAFRRPIPAVALFEAPTISALTHYLQPAPLPIPATDILAERRTKARQRVDNQGIALIGMSGRFPGAETVEQFWQNLQAGVESISVFTPAELATAGVDPALFTAPNYVPARPMLAQELVQGFDAAFFGYSPREAELTDPQHRLFLET
ncbi:MAG: SDR family NAD(P)-dependent oxidoreductase, partial [Ktedonobacteraceae bacterium]|nr:SDR family NAD(P)-dependent oxidoreductase [Ktedonobacteraceae bacterium]